MLNTPLGVCVCAYGAKSGGTFFHQLLWGPVEISAPNVWACVTIAILLDLIEGRDRIIFVTMSGITCNCIEGIPSPLGLVFRLFEPNFDRCPI